MDIKIYVCVYVHVCGGEGGIYVTKYYSALNKMKFKNIQANGWT